MSNEPKVTVGDLLADQHRISRAISEAAYAEQSAALREVEARVLGGENRVQVGNCVYVAPTWRTPRPRLALAIARLRHRIGRAPRSKPFLSADAVHRDVRGGRVVYEAVRPSDFR